MPIADLNNDLWLVEWEEPPLGISANSEHGQTASTPKKQRQFKDRETALVFIADLEERKWWSASLRDLRGGPILHGSKLKSELARWRADKEGLPS